MTKQRPPDKKSQNQSAYFLRFGDLALIGPVFLFIIVSPYTKVEESFNLQAIHDFYFINPLKYLDKYDHFEFPGVVPRTFVGAAIISLVSSPFAFLLHFFRAPKHCYIYLARGTLGLLGVLAFAYFRSGVRKVFGSRVATFLLLLSATQFHFLFYLSRTLPNTFALILAMIGFGAWMHERYAILIWLFTFLTAIFRFEFLIFFGPLMLTLLALRKDKLHFFASSVIHGILAGISSLVLTVPLDTFMWKKFIWPEFEVLYFNTVLNKSKEWGTSPFHWYFSSALPRALLSALPLSVVGVYASPRKTLPLILPCLAFVGLYSVLPHKELRFIFYVLPLFTAIAAVGLNYLYEIRSKKSILPFLAAMAIVLCSAIATAFLLYISMHNYAGGVALTKLHQLEDPIYSEEKYVHIDTYCAMTGISRFWELDSLLWKYSRKENLSTSEDFEPFTHLLRENATAPSASWNLIGTVQGFDRVQLKDRHGKYQIPKVLLVDKVFLFKKEMTKSSKTKQIDDERKPIRDRAETILEAHRIIQH